MMRKVLFALLGVSLLATQPVTKAATITRFPIAINYDLDRPDANPYYCSTSKPNTGNGAIVTSGSATTLTGLTDAFNSFAGLAEGDVIEVLVAGVITDLVIVTATDADNVVVDTAVDLGVTGVSWYYYKTTCGQAATSGWINVAPYQRKTWRIAWTQGDLGGGLDWRLECKAALSYAPINQVYPATGWVNIAAAGALNAAANTLFQDEPADLCRVALLAHTADAADVVGATREIITVTFEGSN
jgi:hypothetical protein